MSRNYTRDHLKISVVKILQTLGWNSMHTTPLEILTDILGNYIGQITRSTNSYANEFGCTQPNLDHLGLTFRDMGINISELEEYVKYVNFGPAPNPVPKYPLPKEDHLNFLKPGSKEVVTRPVHIHEHLPPMNPLLEGNKSEIEVIKAEEPEETSNENIQIFKKPADISPCEFKRLNFRREEEGSRPTREISSVMMTTSGFLSPAREGKLPESRTPISSVDPVNVPCPISENVDIKKPTKVVKKKFKPEDVNSFINKTKPTSGKPKQQKIPIKIPNSNPSNDVNTPVQTKAKQAAKMNKALFAARQITEKLNTTITPIPVRTENPQTFSNEFEHVDKLFTEPDKKKINILKKISNVKNEKNDNKIKKDDVKEESRESSPDLIIDEPDDIPKFTHLTNDVTIEPITNTTSNKSPEKMDTHYFDDDSQPGTPSTPKTPEMISHSPPVIKEKRKRKDSKKIKRIQKNQSPHRLDNDGMDLDMERPKTPEAQVLPKMELPPIVSVPLGGAPPIAQLPFPFSFGPGLIPPPLTNPLIPPLTFPPMNLYNFGQKPPLSTFHQKISEPPPANQPNDVHIPDELTKTNDKPLSDIDENSPSSKLEKKNKEHKKEKKDKKRNKKDKINKAEKKKLKEEKKEKKLKEKKGKRNKDKETKEVDSPGVKLTFKLKSPSPKPIESETRKLNIKPIVKTEEEEATSNEDRVKRETSPGLAKISALVCGPPKPKPINPPKTVPPAEDTVQEEIQQATPRNGPGPGRPRIHPIKPKPPKPKKRRTPIKKDSEGNEVWICPGCGRQDDGSPMIGCDGCDAWYHWVCVGIQVPPDENEDWYCRHCLLKKNEDLQSDKQKKKRKKKEKKEH